MVTFGGGSQRHVDAAHRLGGEARTSGWFDDVVIESPLTLASEHADFWKDHRPFLQANSRLYGYAIWKPYLIRHHLNSLAPDWGLCYLDAGCVLNPNPQSRERLEVYRERAADTGLWATRLDLPRWGYQEFTEWNWTKSDVLDAFDAGETARSSPQLQSGMLMMTPSPATHELASAWEQFSVMDGYRLSTDAPSRLGEPAGFIEHRHDQSLFSVAAKTLGFTGQTDDTWFAPDWFLSGRKHPIWAARWRYASPMRPWNWRYGQRVLRRTWTRGSQAA